MVGKEKLIGFAHNCDWNGNALWLILSFDSTVLT